MLIQPAIRCFALAACLVALSASAQQFHPADVNQDSRIEQAELTVYAAAFAAGENWSTPPTVIPETYLRQATHIWRNGETYHQLDAAPLPQAWVPSPAGGRTFLALAQTSPEPLDFVEVFGLPETVSELVAEVQIPGETEIYYTLVSTNETGSWEMIVPLRRDSSDGGGEVNITLRNQHQFFPLGVVDIAPLPPAPGAAAGVAQDLIEMQELYGDLFGYDLSFFQNYPAESLEYLPNETRALALVDELLRSNANDNNLVNLLQGTAPILQELDYDPELMDRIWGKLSVSGYLDGLRTAISSAQAYPAIPQLQETRFVISDSTLPINDLDSLSYWMNQQCDAEVNTASGTERAQFLQKAGTVNTVIGLMGPVGGAFSLGAGTTMFALDTYNQAMANLLPSSANMELVVSKPVFIEDKCETGRWDAFLHATSKGWSLDKTLVSGAFQAYGAGRAVSGLKSTIASGETFAKIADSKQDYVDAVAGTTLDRYFPNDTSVITINPSYWENIPITDGDLDKVTVETVGSAIKISSLGQRFYEPNEAGTGALKVTLNPGLLGCEAQQGGSAVVKVEENKVSLTPNGGEIEPNQTITFVATVYDAEHKELGFAASHGSILSTTYNDTTGVHQMVWKAPPDEEFPTGPITIAARSLTQECLRSGVVRERVAYFTGKAQDLVLGPAVKCVQKGAEVVFKVQDLNFGELPQIQWNLSGGGTLNPDGDTATYHAPSVKTTGVTVTATTVEEEPRELSVTFMVDECVEATTTLTFNEVLGTQSHVTGLMNSSDHTGEGGIGSSDAYLLDVAMNITKLSDGTVSGTYAGLGVTEREVPEYYDDPFTYEDGASQSYEFYHPSYGPYRYSVNAILDVESVGDSDNYFERVSENEIRVYFDASRSSLSPGLLDELELVNWEWDFGDGSIAQGQHVSHVFKVGPQYDFFVTLKVTGSRGGIATRTKVYRCVKVAANFSGDYLDNGITSCLADFNPDGSCGGELVIEGVKPATLPQISLSGAPSGEGVHGIIINHVPND
ncbi:hypothetical protein GC207_10580 [bacterium]|nr:hypothetical protein [bacterium]